MIKNLRLVKIVKISAVSFKIINQCSHFLGMASEDNIKNTGQLQENTFGGKYMVGCRGVVKLKNGRKALDWVSWS